ncbi:MAG: mechanosensitive ion channel family protein [Betaproteobacteria bacterium]
MLDHDLILDAGYIAVAGLALALVTMWFRRDLRGAMFRLSIIVVVGVGALMLLGRYAGALGGGTLVTVLREGALLVLTIGVVGIAIAFAFEAALGKLGMPRILADVMVALVLVVYALYRMNAAGVNLATIITTSTVITGVIAFSLNATLGNLWGGIALQLDNTCRIGDWVRLEGVTGQIVGIRWRYLAVATNNGETVMVPNAQLVNNRVTVLSRRGDARIHWRRAVEFNVVYGIAPSRVIAAVEGALRRTEIRNVSESPHPTVLCRSFDDSGIRYVARYWLTELLHDEWTDSQIRVHIAAALIRHGFDIPFPHRVLVNAEVADAAELRERELDARQAVLARLELFAKLTDQERRALASELATSPYASGDLISQQGELAESLFVLAQGRVLVYREEEQASGKFGPRTKLATVDAPNHFGEMGLLTGQARAATVIADGDVLCYRLDKDGFDAILQARPELASALSQVVVARQVANDATLQAASAEARARQASGRADEMLRRIRDFFGLAA